MTRHRLFPHPSVSPPPTVASLATLPTLLAPPSYPLSLSDPLQPHSPVRYEPLDTPSRRADRTVLLTSHRGRFSSHPLALLRRPLAPRKHVCGLHAFNGRTSFWHPKILSLPSDRSPSLAFRLHPALVPSLCVLFCVLAIALLCIDPRLSLRMTLSSPLSSPI